MWEAVEGRKGREKCCNWIIISKVNKIIKKNPSWREEGLMREVPPSLKKDWPLVLLGEAGGFSSVMEPLNIC